MYFGAKCHSIVSSDLIPVPSVMMCGGVQSSFLVPLLMANLALELLFSVKNVIILVAFLLSGITEKTLIWMIIFHFKECTTFLETHVSPLS